MIITVITVAMVQTPVDQVVQVIAVGNQGMPAAIVAALAGYGSAAVGIGGAHCDNMLIVVAFVWMMQMAVVQVIHMLLVLNAQMATMFAVEVGMVGMNLMAHGRFLY